MVRATMSGDDRELLCSPYSVLESWQRTYEGNLPRRTAGHLRDHRLPAPCPGLGGAMERVPHRFQGPDRRRRGDRRLVGGEGAGPTGEATDLLDAWTSTVSRGPTTTSPARVRLGFGWGTLLTNDLRDCAPVKNPGLDPISLVCKGDPREPPADGQAVRQPGKGVRPAGAHRTLPDGLRMRGAGAQGARRIAGGRQHEEGDILPSPLRRSGAAGSVARPRLSQALPERPGGSFSPIPSACSVTRSWSRQATPRYPHLPGRHPDGREAGDRRRFQHRGSRRRRRAFRRAG